MLNIKSLSSGLAAAALVSTIGLAYAQTSGQSTSPTPSQTVQNAPGSQGTTGSSSSSGMNNSTSGSSSGSSSTGMNNSTSGSNSGSSMNSSTDSGLSTDNARQARGDRN